MDEKQEKALKEIYNRIEEDLNALRHIRQKLYDKGAIKEFSTIADAIVCIGVGTTKLEKILF
jgi:hypothetical protein